MTVFLPIAAIELPWAIVAVAVILVLATSLSVLGRGN